MRVFVSLVLRFLLAAPRSDGKALPWINYTLGESMVVNLDQPPSQRWRQVAEKYKKQLPKYLTHFNARAQRWPAEVKKEWLQFHNIDREYEKELMSIVEVVNDSAVTRESLILFNLAYMMVGANKASASIVAAMPNGTVVHAWNVEHGKTAPVVDIQFQRSGTTLYSAPVFVGMTGIHGGMVQGGWSISMNSRWKGFEDLTAGDVYVHNLEAAKAGARPNQYLLRRVMDEVEHFPEAVNRIATASFVSPAYVSMAGPRANEGAVITVDRKADSPLFQAVQTLSPAIDSWFLVQTNDDAWRPDVSDKRRSVLTMDLTLMGQAGVLEASLLRWLRLSYRASKGGKGRVLYQWTAVPAWNRHRFILGPEGQPDMGPSQEGSDDDDVILSQGSDQQAQAAGGPRGMRQLMRLADAENAINVVSNQINEVVTNLEEPKTT